LCAYFISTPIAKPDTETNNSNSNSNGFIMVDYTQYLKDAHVSFSGNDPRKLFGLIDIKLFKNKKFGWDI